MMNVRKKAVLAGLVSLLLVSGVAMAISPLGLGGGGGGGTAFTDSASLAAAISDETGTGLLVMGTAPALSSPRIDGTISGSMGVNYATSHLLFDGIEIYKIIGKDSIGNSANRFDADSFIGATFGNGLAAGDEKWIFLSDKGYFINGTTVAARPIVVGGVYVSSTTAADLDTGIARNAAGVVEINNGTAGTLRDLKARDVTLAGLFTSTPQAVTCAAGAGKSALTITPTSSYVEITNADADGCDITMSETGMTAGAAVTLCIVSSAGTTVDFADTAGVTELAGAFAGTVDDCIGLRYGNPGTWREHPPRSAN